MATPVVTRHPIDRPPPARRDPSRRLYLLPSGDGWSLVTSSGEVLVRGLGQRSLRQCLAHARGTGSPALLARP